jgi:hypothetical protein
MQPPVRSVKGHGRCGRLAATGRGRSTGWSASGSSASTSARSATPSRSIPERCQRPRSTSSRAPAVRRILSISQVNAWPSSRSALSAAAEHPRSSAANRLRTRRRPIPPRIQSGSRSGGRAPSARYRGIDEPSGRLLSGPAAAALEHPRPPLRSCSAGPPDVLPRFRTSFGTSRERVARSRSSQGSGSGGRSSRLARFSADARPGLEPGTPRVSAVARPVRPTSCGGLGLRLGLRAKSWRVAAQITS